MYFLYYMFFLLCISISNSGYSQIQEDQLRSKNIHETQVTHTVKPKVNSKTEQNNKIKNTDVDEKNKKNINLSKQEQDSKTNVKPKKPIGDKNLYTDIDRENRMNISSKDVQSTTLNSTNTNNKKKNILKIISSSSLASFIKVIVEEFSLKTLYNNPQLEFMDTAPCFRNFCSGIHNIVFSSRKIHPTEIQMCKSNNINIEELVIGYDGIILVRSKSTKDFYLSKVDIYKAIAKNVIINGKIVKNPYKYWSNINKNFPNEKIEIYGPAMGSATYNELVEKIMLPACTHSYEIQKTYEHDINLLKKQCSEIRKDGGYIESSNSNQGIILNKIINNKGAIGIVNFGFYKSNDFNLNALNIDYVKPSRQTIALEEYGLSRNIYMYFSKNFFASSKEMHGFLKYVSHPNTIGRGSYLKSIGFIPIDESMINKIIKKFNLNK